MQKTTWQVRVASKTLPRTSHRFMRGDPDLRRERVKDVITSLRRSCDCRIGKGSCDVVSSRFESLGFPKQNCMYLSSNPVYWCFLRLTTFSDWCSSASKLSWTKCCSDIRGPNCRRTAEINIAVRLLYSIFSRAILVSRMMHWIDSHLLLLQPCVRSHSVRQFETTSFLDGPFEHFLQCRGPYLFICFFYSRVISLNVGSRFFHHGVK